MAKKNNALAITAICLSAAIGVGLAVNFLTEDRKWDNLRPEQQEEQTDEAFGGGIVNSEEGGPISLSVRKLAVEEYGDYGIMAIADTAWTLTVSYEESGVVHTAVDYTVKWKSGASGQFGSGKTVTDYVTCVPTSDGALTAAITVKQAFGEQVEIVVTNRVNPDCTKTATVDYAKKMTGFTESKWKIDDTDLPLVTLSAKTTATSTSSVTLHATQNYGSTYSVNDTFTMDVTGKLNESFVSAFTTYAKTTSYYTGNTTVKAAVDGMASGLLNPNCSTMDFENFFYVMGSFCDSWRALTTDSTAKTAMAQLVASYLYSDANVWRTPFFIVTFTFTGTYSTFTRNVHFGYSQSGFGSAPTSMSFSKAAFVA